MSQPEVGWIQEACWRTSRLEGVRRSPFFSTSTTLAAWKTKGKDGFSHERTSPHLRRDHWDRIWGKKGEREGKRGKGKLEEAAGKGGARQVTTSKVALSGVSKLRPRMVGRRRKVGVIAAAGCTAAPLTARSQHCKQQAAFGGVRRCFCVSK